MKIALIPPPITINTSFINTVLLEALLLYNSNKLIKFRNYSLVLFFFNLFQKCWHFIQEIVSKWCLWRFLAISLKKKKVLSKTEFTTVSSELYQKSSNTLRTSVEFRVVPLSLHYWNKLPQAVPLALDLHDANKSGACNLEIIYARWLMRRRVLSFCAITSFYRSNRLSECCIMSSQRPITHELYARIQLFSRTRPEHI